MLIWRGRGGGLKVDERGARRSWGRFGGVNVADFEVFWGCRDVRGVENGSGLSNVGRCGGRIGCFKVDEVVGEVG